METKRFYLNLGLCLLALFVLLLASISQQHFITEINSDYLYPFEIVQNIIKNQTFSGQNVPAAPYYFPDLLLIFLLNGITHNIALLHYLYSVLFLFFYAFFVTQLFQRVLNHRYLSLAGALIALTQTFFIIAPGFNFLREWPGSHLSVILFSLWFLRVYIDHKPQGFSKLHFTVLFVLSYLMFVSDNLLFAQLFFPVALLIAVDCVFKNINIRPAIALLSMILLVVLLGAKIDIVLEKWVGISYSDNVSLFRIRKFALIDQHIAALLHFFAVSIREHGVAYGLLFADTLCSLIFIFNLKNKKTRTDLMGIFFFLYFAVGANIILALLVGKLTDIAYFRYLATLYLFPPIGAALVVVSIIKDRPTLKWLIWALVFINLGLGCVLYPPFLLKGFNLSPPYNEDMACIDALHTQYLITNGLAEYWSTRPVRMLSKVGITTAQINKDLKFFNFVDNQSHFLSNSYQFIIVNKLSHEKIENALGKPDKIVFCPSHEIWLYVDKDSNMKINQYFLSQRLKV